MWEDLMTDRPTTLRRAERLASLDWDLAPSQRSSLLGRMFRRQVDSLPAPLSASTTTTEPAVRDDSLPRAA